MGLCTAVLPGASLRFRRWPCHALHSYDICGPGDRASIDWRLAHRKESGSKPSATPSQRGWLLPIAGLSNIGKISQHTAGRAPWTALVRSDPIQLNSFLAGCVMSSLFSRQRSMHVATGARMTELRASDEDRSDE